MSDIKTPEKLGQDGSIAPRVLGQESVSSSSLIFDKADASRERNRSPGSDMEERKPQRRNR